MVGNLVAKMATRCRDEPADLYAASRPAGRPDLHANELVL